MSTIPPLPGEPLLSVAEVAERANCSRQAIHDAIRNGKLMACRAAGRILIAEREAERFIREWPARRKGVAARWCEFREWQAHQRAASRQPLTPQADAEEGTVS
jgi:excisionase family DNA binding protein